MDSILAKLRTPIAELWANNKVFLILAFIVIIVLKFQDVIFAWIVSSAKKELAESTAKSNQLKIDETQANTQANGLVDQANSLDDNKSKVDENWNKQ